MGIQRRMSLLFGRGVLKYTIKMKSLDFIHKVYKNLLALIDYEC